jgi:hypothetical protein
LYRRDITEYLPEIALLPGDVFLELDREVLVLFDTLQVLVDRADKSTRLDLSLASETVSTWIIHTEAIEYIRHFLTIGIERSRILIQFTLEYPWDIDWNCLLRDSDEWELSDDLICSSDG